MSAKVSVLSDLEFRVWVNMVLGADDFGVMLRSAAKLRGESRALLALPEPAVDTAMGHVVQVGLFLPFAHQGEQWLCDPVWQDFQKIRYPRRTYYPAPGAEILARCSEDTRALFRRLHPAFLGAEKEGQMSDLVAEAICNGWLGGGERVRQYRREARVGNYRIDVLVQTSRRRLAVEVKREPLSRADLDQVLRYRDALTTEGADPVVPVLVGPELMPSVTVDIAERAGVVLVLWQDRALHIVANPCTSLKLRGEPSASRRHRDGDSSGDSPASGGTRLTANGTRQEAHGKDPGEEVQGKGALAVVDGFDRFYGLYPRRVGRDAAQRAWAGAVKRSPAEAIMAGLERQLPDLRVREAKYIPHPATWLNQGRWQDEPDPTPLLSAKTAGNAAAVRAFVEDLHRDRQR